MKRKDVANVEQIMKQLAGMEININVSALSGTILASSSSSDNLLSQLQQTTLQNPHDKKRTSGKAGLKGVWGLEGLRPRSASSGTVRREMLVSGSNNSSSGSQGRYKKCMSDGQWV